MGNEKCFNSSLGGVDLRNFKSEKETWVQLTNFYLWSILKVLEQGSKYVRELERTTKIHPNTLELWLERMLKWGLVTDRWGKQTRRYFEITERGKKLLSAYHQIGEIVAEIRSATMKARECPKCGSQNVEFSESNFGISVFKCQFCGEKWSEG